MFYRVLVAAEFVDHTVYTRREVDTVSRAGADPALRQLPRGRSQTSLFAATVG